jgi:hypothetical protein
MPVTLITLLENDYVALAPMRTYSQVDSEQLLNTVIEVEYMKWASKIA